MGTNLSQVFISNGESVIANGQTFNQNTSGIGVWDLDNSAFIDSALYKAGVDVTDEVAGTGADATTDAVNDNLTTVANPVWLYNNLQFVQGVAGNQLASPMINSRNIRRITHDPYDQTEGHKVVLTPDSTVFAPATIGDVSVRFVIRTQPVDQLSFYDGDSTNYTILSGSDVLPLGAFNTTNHKVISIDIAEEDYSDVETFLNKVVAGVGNHGLLSKMIAATDGATNCTLQSKHVGLIFDIAVANEAGDSMLADTTADNKIVPGITGQILGVGNPWQVLGEEIRCRYRQGNFNRMYLPQNPTTYTQADGAYNRIVIEYEHNWPTSTGIAPAGTLNQCVLYFDSDGAAVTATEGDFGTVFGVADLTAAEKFIW